MSWKFWAFCGFVGLICAISAFVGSADVGIDNYDIEEEIEVDDI